MFKVNYFIKPLKFPLLKALIILCALLNENTNYAQEITDYGIKTGVSASRLFTDLPDERLRRTKFHIASFVKFHIAEDIIFIQTELGYARKGGGLRFGNQVYELNLDYLDIPLFFSIGHRNISFVEIGGYMSYLLNSQLSNNVSLQNNVVNASHLNRLDIGLVMGLNFNYQNYTVGVRYYYGLRDLPERSMREILGNQARNSVFQFYVSYSWLR